MPKKFSSQLYINVQEFNFKIINGSNKNIYNKW